MKLRIQTIKRDDGERLPLLIGEDGIPLFGPTVYTVSALRARQLAVNSVKSHLRAISYFESFCAIRKIDLSSRLDRGHLLSLAEIDGLVRMCRNSASELRVQGGHGNRRIHDQTVRPLHQQEKIRRTRTQGPARQVTLKVAHTRLSYIREYLDWMLRDRISMPNIDGQLRARLESVRISTHEDLRAREPSGTKRADTQEQREGLASDDRTWLLEVTRRDSSENPWLNAHTRVRNELMIRWLLNLGLRRGELLNVQISDVKFQNSSVDIKRRPHSKEDSRNDQPVVKTVERSLPIDHDLLKATLEYIFEYRREQGKAPRHKYLFVATHTGQPFSLVGIGKTFAALRRLRDKGFKLSAHVLRHTWNEGFSELMDEKGIDPELEKKLRCQLMGWSETSNTAAIYTRRHTRLRAMEASLALQKKFTGKSDG